MAEEQTDPEVQKRIIAEFQLSQEKKRIEKEKRKIEKRLDLWKKLSVMTFPLILLVYLFEDLVSPNIPSRYGLAIIVAVCWLAQIEWRIISIHHDLEKLRAKLENGESTM